MKLYNYIKQQVKRSDFLKVFSGNLIGSSVYAISIPIVTRLFDKAAFGNFQLLFSTVSVFTSFSSLKYEKAIMLAADKQQERKSYVLSVVVLFITTLVLGIALVFNHTWILSLLHAETISRYYYLVIIGVLIEGMLAIASEVAVKEKKIAEYSFNRGFTLVLYGILPIVLLPVSASFSSLFAGRLLAYIISLTYLFWKVDGLKKFQKISFRELFNWADHLKDFPNYYVPLSLITAISTELPIFLLYQRFGAEEVGLYSLAIRIVQMPLALVFNSLESVYYKQASELRDKAKEMMQLYKKTVRRLAYIAIIPLFFLPFMPALFGFALGEQWIRSGEYLQILYPYIFFDFLVAAVSSTIVVLRKIHLFLLLSIVFFVIRYALMVIFNDTPTSMLMAFSLSSSVFFIAFNVFIYFCIKAELKKQAAV